MGKDHKIIFNLTIKDLKELGIIKRRRKNENKYYVNKYGKKIKVPYSNSSSKVPFGEEVKTPNLSKGETFVNTSTINDDTSRLRNELAQQEINDRKNKSSLVDDISSYMNPKLLQITNDIENAKIRNDMENETNRFAMKFLYDNMQSNRFEKTIPSASTFYNPSFQPYIEPTNYVKISDNIDTAQTDGSDSFINSNVAPNSDVIDDNNKSVAGPSPKTPTTQPLYEMFNNLDTDLTSLLQPTPAKPITTKISDDDEEFLNALSDKKPTQELKDLLSSYPTPKKIDTSTPAFLKGIFTTPGATMNTDTETDMRFQPELDNLIPLSQKMGGGMNMNEELKLEKPKTPEPEPEPEPLSDFDQMISEMKVLTTRQKQYLKERKDIYKALADRKGEPHKQSLLNSSKVQNVTEAINELNKKPDVVIKAKRGQKNKKK